MWLRELEREDNVAADRRDVLADVERLGVGDERGGLCSGAKTYTYSATCMLLKRPGQPPAY